MRTSAIIVNYNTAAVTVDCIRSIRSANPGAEIVVVDNASGDGSVAMIETAFSATVRVIVNRSNVGFGAACNQGARAAAGEILFFINSDVSLPGDVISGLRDRLRDDAGIGVAAPRLMLTDGRPQPHAYGREPGIGRLLLDRSKPRTDMAVPEKGLIGTDWVSGAAFAIKRSLFLDLGGFDERFFMYFEDVDLCRRCRAAGFRVTVDPALRAVHAGGKSFQSRPGEQKRLYYESQDKYFSKYHSRPYCLFLSLARPIYIHFQTRAGNRSSDVSV